MLDTATPPQTAAESLRGAIENEASLKAAHDQKRRALAAAVTAKEKLIASAATGAAVKPDDVLKAEAAVRQAEIEAQLAGNIHAGAVTLRHKAQLAQWYGEAEQLRQAAEAAAQALHAADAEIDRLAEPLRQAIREYSDRLADLEAARSAARFFNSQRDMRNKTNPVLAQQDSGIGDPFVMAAMPGTSHSWPAVKRLDGHDIARRVGLPVARAD